MKVHGVFEHVYRIPSYVCTPEFVQITVVDLTGVVHEVMSWSVCVTGIGGQVGQQVSVVKASMGAIEVFGSAVSTDVHPQISMVVVIVRLGA